MPWRGAQRVIARDGYVLSPGDRVDVVVEARGVFGMVSLFVVE